MAASCWSDGGGSARIVEALEALAGERLAEQVDRLAHHALRGEVWGKALAYCRQAGRTWRARPTARLSCPSSRRSVPSRICWSIAIREQGIDLRLALRTALRPLGDKGRMLAILHEAEALAGALDDSRRLGQVSHFWQTISPPWARMTRPSRRPARPGARHSQGDVVLHALANSPRPSLPYPERVSAGHRLPHRPWRPSGGRGATSASALIPCQPWPPCLARRAMLNWACSPRAVPSATKGSRLLRRLRTPGA